MSKKIGIILGSKKDVPYMEDLFSFLKEEGIGYDLEIGSCHRTPKKVDEIIKKWKSKNVIVAAAGYSAQLPGYIASRSDLPVIGVPLPTSDLNGLDALLSIVQMPKGFAVLGSGVGKAGALNAGIFIKKLLK
ncbi:N5-carboxyaminoimidazole ribonucleotide mutase [subsurface metagenome]